MKLTIEPVRPVEAGARLMHSIPPMLEEHLYKKAFNLVGDFCHTTKNFLITGWGTPQQRLESIIRIIRDTGVDKRHYFLLNDMTNNGNATKSTAN